FIVDNRPGAGGNIGTNAATKATPDGYTLVMGSTGPMAANRTLYRDLGYDPEKDLEPISLFAHFPILIVVSSKLPVKSVAEFVTTRRPASTSSTPAPSSSEARNISPGSISSRSRDSNSPSCLTATSRNTCRT